MKLLKALKNPHLFFERVLWRLAPYIKDDETYLKWDYYFGMRKFPNLKNPQSFNEKLQWLKLYNHNPLYTTLVDKLKVKDYVISKIGEEHVIKTLGVWESVNDIEWNLLPNRFVMKTTQAGGNVGIVICRDKSKLDIEKAKKNIQQGLDYDLYVRSREWPYKNVKPMIFAEEYMEDEYGELRDYKFFCFDGKVRALFIATDRQKREEPYFNFFDENFNPLPMKQGHPVIPVNPVRPKGFNDMIRVAETLSKGLPHVRLDLYVISGVVYFGEFTFFHFGANMPFEPEEWDYKFGEWLTLPPKM